MKRFFLLLSIALMSAASSHADPPQPEPETFEQEAPTPATSTALPSHNYKKQFTGTLIAIVLVVSLVFFIIWLLRRFSCERPLHMNHRKHIKVIERRPLSPNTFIYLIQVGDKQFVIAESKFHVHNVATLDWNETTPE